ncbi:MAG: transcription termination/antitermination protein NusG [bacterium]|nr:transcription termination/antitermination protein NusG [bacterium]
MEVTDLQWYVVRAISGQEKKVKANLESELEKAKLTDYVPQILIPMEKVYTIKNGKKIAKDKNYFPGYILVQMKFYGEVEATIKGINGVVGFLGSKEGPVPLRQAEVNRILGNADENGAIDPEGTEPFIVGEPIKVTDGPFSGFSGVIEEVNDEKKKVKVMVKIFGRRTPLELNYNQIEKE